MHLGVAREMHKARRRAHSMSRHVAREARELTKGETTTLYVAGGIGVLALGWLALRGKPASASTSTTTITPATPAPSATTPATPAAPSAPAAPSMAGAQTYISDASQGNAFPWSPPDGVVAASPSDITPSTVVTDPALIAMAQHALYYIGLTASSNGITVTPYPVSGITGQVNSEFTSDLASFQRVASGGPGSVLGSTALNTSGTLDYKTLGLLIFVSLVYYVKANGLTPTNSNGLDSPLLSLSRNGLSHLVSVMSPSLSNSSETSQLRSMEINIDSSSGTNGAMFAEVGVMNWQGWSLCVGLGA